MCCWEMIKENDYFEQKKWFSTNKKPCFWNEYLYWVTQSILSRAGSYDTKKNIGVNFLGFWSRIAYTPFMLEFTSLCQKYFLGFIITLSIRVLKWPIWLKNMFVINERSLITMCVINKLLCIEITQMRILFLQVNQVKFSKLASLFICIILYFILYIFIYFLYEIWLFGSKTPK